MEYVGIIWGPLINKHPPFKGPKIRIPMIIPIWGRGFIEHGSGLNPKPSATGKGNPKP